jgi:alpha-glucosidase
MVRSQRTLLLFTFLLAAFTASSSAQTAPVAQAVHSADPWWKHAVVYEIYPRSFQDSNGDGVGDLNGITSRLDYLQKLGVDAIWIAPMYPSPQVDFGYDISDYKNVDPQYGTLADFDKLQAAAKKHGIRILLDMVLNHTSDKAAWFQESASSRTNPKADWYVWNDGKPANSAGVTEFELRYVHDGPHGRVVPPNNWVALFGGSAWEWVPERGQYFYHEFYKQQPDLNWRNPAVEKAMFDTMRFWLDRGVAGFRLDAITTIYEDPSLKDEPLTGSIDAYGDPLTDRSLTDNREEVHALVKRMRTMADSYPGDRVLIGETYLPNTAELDKWYGGEARDELHLPMDMLPGFGAGATLSAPYMRRYLSEVQTQVHGGQPLIVFDNHDNVRSLERFGDGVHNTARAKVLAAMLYTAHATALTYYGAELGMTTETPTRKEDVKDPIGIMGWPKEKGRDGERTPMQWTPGPQAGFSTNPQTWLPIPANHTTINVATEEKDPASLLNWTRKLTALRHTNVALRDGDMQMLNPDDADVLSYVRTAGKARVLVALNMSAAPKTVSFAIDGKARTLAASDSSLKQATFQSVTLPAFTAWVAAVE